MHFFTHLIFPVNKAYHLSVILPKIYYHLLIWSYSKIVFKITMMYLKATKKYDWRLPSCTNKSSSLKIKSQTVKKITVLLRVTINKFPPKMTPSIFADSWTYFIQAHTFHHDFRGGKLTSISRAKHPISPNHGSWEVSKSDWREEPSLGVRREGFLFFLL